ncbi:response regulator transcription factor [Nosocomiicoccus ampullae]|uniref:Two-component system response regulator protein BraR/BceR n=1 Tax=Nosocomiicoccus ampullae TaxID=489910 RepID=A0A9Q2HDS9_9STAP|nr:response regulator transcription factor [Nosocomiicoccus ampullae]MBB5175198.1 two-component system response regulator protein BraR/BceR [Nosocomiicoccus ampullae]QYA46424.1 response regulator transcription factor [Nosocomiicoccus ampullae]
MKILIIEDDKIIRESFKLELNKWNFKVNYVENFNTITEQVKELKPHIILLDINLPSYNGYYWCQEIRKFSTVPIVFISSRHESMDQVMAMQMGGDDFIEKPFNMNVVISKIQALIRRTYEFNEDLNVLKKGKYNLSLDTMMFTYKEKSIEFTHTEYLIMQLLLQNLNHFVSRNSLIERCWESSHFIDDNTLAVNIARLRKKLKSIDLEGAIETKKNYGYRLKDD